MASESAADLRQALDDGRVGQLAYELRYLIEDDVPVLHNANRVNQRRAAQNTGNQIASSTLPKGDPTIPPKRGSPFLKLPAEIRRLIFLRYLLPAKAKNIEPKCYLQRRNAVLKKSRDEQSAATRARGRVQQQAQIVFQGAAHWNATLQQPLPHIIQQPPAPVPAPAPAPGPQPVLPPSQQPAPQTGNNQQAPLQPLQQAVHPAPPQPTVQILGHPPQQFPHVPHNATYYGVPPPTANPLNGWTGNPQQPPPQMVNTANNPAPAPNLVGVQYNNGPTAPAPGWNLFQTPAFHNFATLPGGVAVAIPHPPAAQQPGPPLPPPPPTTNPSNDMEEEDEDVQKAIADSLNVDIYDTTPENIIIRLLTTNVKLCLEVSTILYEEYTFEVHIHSNGVEFLHFDRIPTLETWGLAIEKTMGAFKTKGHFCFHRMKHLEFVFFGGDPKDRLAGLRMRESTQKLVSFLRTERKPLMSLKIRFEYEQADQDKDWGLSNAVTDEFGTFWSTLEKQSDKSKSKNKNKKTWREPRTSIMHEVSNIQLVCAPLKALRNVSKFDLQFPAELEGNKTLTIYASTIETTIKSCELSDDDQDEIMREEMLMDARRDKELQIAGAGGYYHQDRKLVGDDRIAGGMIAASEFMMDEVEVEEVGGLIRPFGGQLSAARFRGQDYEMGEDIEFADISDSELQALEEDFDVEPEEENEELDTLPSPSYPATLTSAGSFRAPDRLGFEESNHLFRELDAEMVASTRNMHRTHRVEEADAFGPLNST